MHQQETLSGREKGVSILREFEIDSIQKRQTSQVDGMAGIVEHLEKFGPVALRVEINFGRKKITRADRRSLNLEKCLVERRPLRSVFDARFHQCVSTEYKGGVGV